MSDIGCENCDLPGVQYFWPAAHCFNRTSRSRSHCGLQTTILFTNHKEIFELWFMSHITYVKQNRQKFVVLMGGKVLMGVCWM